MDKFVFVLIQGKIILCESKNCKTLPKTNQMLKTKCLAVFYGQSSP